MALGSFRVFNHLQARELPESEKTAVVVAGELDVADVDAFRVYMAHVLDECRGSSLDVDLSALKFIDAAGIGAFIAVRKHARQLDIRVNFAQPTSAVRKPFVLCGLETIFDDAASDNYVTTKDFV